MPLLFLFIPLSKQRVIYLWLDQVRSIQRHAHKDTDNETRSRKSEEPSKEDLAELPPVDRPHVTGGEGDTDNSASDALGGGNRETQSRSQEDGDGRSQLH